MDSSSIQSITNKSKIAILLSTYNGSRYITDLIESILSQSCQDFTLYIRDDGSKDETFSIIKRYASISNKVIIVNDKSGNMGSKYSFLHMTKTIKSDYYMFCDQDDVWLKNKVKVTYECILENEGKCGKNTPITVHTDLRVVDQDLKILYPSYWKQCRISDRMPHSVKYLAHYNDITGCAQMFNRAAVLKADRLFDLELPKYVYHDWLLAMNVAKAGGKIIALPIQTILFRRHQTNETVAVQPYSSFILRLLSAKVTFRRLKERYEFAKPFGFNSLSEYMYYKFLVYLNRIWIQKRV
jgi:rhamnosyltransferase